MRGRTAPLFSGHVLRQRAVRQIGLAILASRLLMVVFAYKLNGHDADRYLQIATNVLQYGIYSSQLSSHPTPQAHDLPGFPLILSGLLLVCKNLWLTMRAAAVLNAIAYTGAAIAVYALLVLAGGSKEAATWAMVLFGLFPESLPYSIIVMPESLFMAAFLASLFFTVRFLLEPRAPMLWAAFALLGVSVLLKPVSVLFAVVVVAGVGLRFWRSANVRIPVILALLSSLMVEAAVCSPWLIRNYRNFGSVSFTTITGSNLFWYNYRYMLLDKGLPPEIVQSFLESQMKRVAAQTPGYDTNPMIQTQALQHLVVSEIAADPLAYARTVAKRYPNLYGGTGTLDLIDLFARVPHAPSAPLNVVFAKHPALQPLRVILSALLCLLYVLVVSGIVILVKRRLWRPLLLACIPILYFSAIFGPVTASRYRFAMTPFFAMLAAYGIPKRLRKTSTGKV